MCKGKYWWQVRVGNEPWFYRDIPKERVEAIEVEHIVHPVVIMEKISINNIPPKSVQDQLKKVVIKKV